MKRGKEAGVSEDIATLRAALQTCGEAHWRPEELGRLMAAIDWAEALQQRCEELETALKTERSSHAEFERQLNKIANDRGVRIATLEGALRQAEPALAHLISRTEGNTKEACYALNAIRNVMPNIRGNRPGVLSARKELGQSDGADSPHDYIAHGNSSPPGCLSCGRDQGHPIHGSGRQSEEG